MGAGARAEGGGPDAQGNFPGYNSHGFLLWQQAISRAIVESSPEGASLKNTLDNIKVQRFPYPRYLEDRFIYAIQFGLPLLLMLSFVFTALSITRDIVHEKERRLKESMKMMGLYNAVHWAAWYFKCFVFLLVRAALLSFL